MNVYGQTHIGLVRENNQDALEYGTLSNTAQYAVVCDGMGGANGGNIASKIAVEVIGSRIRDGYRENQNPGSVEHLLTSAMATANVGVYDRAQRDAELSGMGTTVVAVITCELALRILTDYIDGDVYFKTSYEGHNLVRARAQMKLLTEVEAKLEDMYAFVDSLLKA